MNLRKSAKADFKNMTKDKLLKTENPKFWAVWKLTGGFPSVRHPSLEAAKAEASRLASRYNEEFCVLEVVGVAAPPPQLTVEWREL